MSYVCGLRGTIDLYPMKRNIRLSLLFVALPFLLNAQAFILGWSGGHANPKELNRTIYVYNSVNASGLTKEMKQVHWVQGPFIGFHVGTGVYGEFCFSHKQQVVASEFDSSGVAMMRQMKVISNTMEFGMGVRQDGWGFGGSIGIGRFKGKGKRGPSEGIKDMEYQKLWTIDDTRLAGIKVYQLYLTETIFVERSFGGFLTMRLYAQLSASRNPMDGLDPWFFGDFGPIDSYLNWATAEGENLVNYGVTVYLGLGKNQ
jgi:hypothetical protein